MRAAIYCRVSTKEQVQNLSLPTQLKACRDFCDRNGYDIAAEFTDAGESAKTTDRPEFRKLIDFCRANKRRVQFVVFFNVTRFSRSHHDFSVVKALLLQYGVSMRSVNEPLSDDPVGNLTGNIVAAVAQFENDEKARRTKCGMVAALELGRWPFQPPLGYLVGGDQKGRLVADSETAPFIKGAFERFGTGRHSKVEVLRRVTALGLKARNGKPLTPQSFGNLLRNRLYAGWLVVPKWGFEAKGDFAQLVPEVLFARVQRLLDGRGDALPAT